MMQPGDHISHYHILEKLGEGGMGVVYKAHDTKLDRDVALKFLHTGPDGSDEEHQRFLNEARAAAKLSHANICNIYSIREHDGQPFIEMEFIEGETLRGKLPGITGDLTAAVNLAVQIAAGLSAAHKKGIVHRDIKPENIMVTGEGQVKIMDFGLARLQGIGSMTREGSTVGTMAYMSPEQIRSEEIDHRSDQFSFGMMLFEMLTGKRAFRGEHEAALMYSIVNEEPDTGILEQAGVPEQMTGILTRCLQKEPEQRYNKTEELLNDLQSFARSSSKVQELTFGSGGTGTSGAARIKMAAAAVIILAAAIGGYLYFTNDSTVNENLVPNRVAVVVFENQTGDPSLDPIGRMAADWLIQGLARTEIVDIVPSEVSLATYQQEHTLQHNIERISESTYANIIIAGTYYRQGNSLYINPRIFDVTQNRILVSLDPVQGEPENPVDAISLLQQQVMGALASVLDEHISLYIDSSRDPVLYPAYVEFLKGQEQFIRERNYLNAIPHYQKALELDSSFTTPLIWLAASFANSGQTDTGKEMFLNIHENYREQLVPADRFIVQAWLAIFDGNLSEAYENMKKAGRLTPGSGYQYLWASFALRINRPNEAIEVLGSINPESEIYKDWEHYWTVLCSAYHVLGRHMEEIKCAEDARLQFPEKLNVLVLGIRSLAALGDENEIIKITEDIKNSTSFSANYAELMILAAREFRIHGYKQAGVRMYKRLEEHLHQTYPELPDDDAVLHWFGDLYLDTDRPAQAIEIFERLHQKSPENISWLGRLGVVQAMNGEQERAAQAREQLESIDRPYINGLNYAWMAAITAHLGEPDQALSYLQEAHLRGMRFSVNLHRFIELEPLYGHPGFIEFMRPKG